MPCLVQESARIRQQLVGVLVLGFEFLKLSDHLLRHVLGGESGQFLAHPLMLPGQVMAFAFFELIANAELDERFVRRLDAIFLLGQVGPQSIQFLLGEIKPAGLGEEVGLAQPP